MSRQTSKDRDLGYDQQIDLCFGPGGTDREKYTTLLARCAEPLAHLKSQYEAGTLPLLRLPERRDDLIDAGAIAAELSEKIDTLIILGTGGSSLGGKTLTALAAQDSNRPNLLFLDNIDPETFDRIRRKCKPDRTGLLVISKSGSTVETLTQLTSVASWLGLKNGIAEIAPRTVAITEPRDNPLRRLTGHLNIKTLDHDPNVGGRFSCLSLVGLLPAMVAGLDVDAIRAGAETVLRRTLDATNPQEAEPAIGAALAVALGETKPISVMLPYSDRLESFAAWHRQLWAESLGKSGLGTTPVDALGTVDQHSQLQLYLDGPADKFFTILAGDTRGQGAAVDEQLLDAAGNLDYIRGRRMGDVFAAEQEATIDALSAAGRPVRILRLADGRLDEYRMGALMMHFMLETIIAAGLLGIDPFDQPAVEAGKIMARDYLADFASLATRMDTA